MKNLLYILLLSPLFFISSCEEEEESENGYDCVSNTCTAVFENPQYLTLSDCQSACEDNNGGNSNLEIGDIYQGGMIFYIDETGEHGLVAALEDLTEGSNMGTSGIAEGFEWGCDGTSVATALQNLAIGTGLANTEAIVSQNCQTENGGITAAQASLNYEIDGYTDWFLPSFNELEEMYVTIGNGGSEGNLGGFEIDTNYFPSYSSSSEQNINEALGVVFYNGYSGQGYKTTSFRVRCIRAF